MRAGSASASAAKGIQAGHVTSRRREMRVDRRQIFVQRE